ncbi:protein TASOR [Enoplosus armatus]|uniref:protein TASOR n=1 Tax=Enoplosus armatus TaxID=215367 RepID=UPI003991C975
MESGNGDASSKGVLIPVSAGSDVFQSNILSPLKSAYLYEESQQSFRYKSAVLIKNPALEEKYNAFRAKRREVGYSEEDLKESYGFLLFDDVNKANALGETGVLTGNSTCTTLGDPLNGVYISMYSDCLDLNRWYHGKSGYIAIIRLTKGRVKKVLENYTQNFTAPTEGFDCHVSEQLPSVSSKTSSFLAFERTQYYMYELLDDGNNETTQSPSAACPFAVVSFSYTDTKATFVAPQEKSEEKKLVCHYFPWRGQLQIGSQFFGVGLRSTAGALIPAELPPVVKVDRAISMLNLRQLLPRAVFDTCSSGEVFLDGLYCSLYALVSFETEETNSLSLLLREIKEKDIALTIPLKDGGFLILLHTSHFLTFDDTVSSASEVLQGMFVFPDSRVVQRDTKCGHRKHAISSEILWVLPVLSYAEGQVEKTPIDPSEELCEVLAQHMQSYAALINPGLALSPSREVSIFPDQYDVPDDHNHLYSSSEWTNRAWQSFKSYLSKPVSFQLPVSKASEILVNGKEERIEDLDDDVYICLSSPEEALANPHSMGSEDQLTDDLPAELIVSITSAERTVTGFSTAKLQTAGVNYLNVKIPVEDDNLKRKEDQAMELSGHLQKTERWDLKPVISECGRILVPHGSADISDQMNSACSSTDALNLLADLALSASNDQVPPQPDPALERKPETSLKKCDLTKDVTSAEQESVLHALLRQPAARPLQPLESPPPSHLVGGSELEDRSEHNHRTPEYLSKHMVRRRKFRHSRTFDIKDGSVQVTKQWKENYDFNLDSKFTSESKDRAIIRALHGPWDSSIQDTNEEVRLIVHMWIGLFYSRSTDRFFHVDSNCTDPFSSDPNPHHGLGPDLELRTLRALSIDKFLSKSSHTGKSSQIETAGMKHTLDQTPNPSIKYIPTCLATSHTLADSKDKKISNTKPVVVSASTSQELNTESSGHCLKSPFSKLEEVLGVRLQLKKTDTSVHQHYFERTDKIKEETSVVQDYCHPHRSFPSTECLQAIKSNIDQGRHKTSQTNLSNEPHSYNQRPVMAVKPSKSDEIQADCISEGREVENYVMSVFSNNKQTKTPIVSYITPATMLFDKKTESLKGNSEGLNDDKQQASHLSFKSSWLSNDRKPNSDEVKSVLLDPSYQYEGRDITKFNKIPSSSPPLHSFEFAKTSSKLVDKNQGLVEKIGQTTKESIEMDQNDCSDASTSVVDYKDDSIMDGSLFLGPPSSLTCTVYNTSRKKSYSFLEQLSQRFLQDDVTQASMEQECLIFSEQMKQLLKRSKIGSICQPDAHDQLNWSCSSPVTVHFSSLEEQEDSVDHLDAPSLVGQKIKVDMSDRKDLADTTEEEKTLHLQKLSQTGNQMEHAGVSGMTAECARVYEAMMNDVCAIKKVPSRQKHFRMDRGYPKTKTSNHFDFCDQMKREMDESFRSNLNSVVKKSCKTKYRFYILVTSDDAFFEETKAQLEAEGHTAVQPSEFFLGEDSSSSLLIILRNEDIAGHICEVPHLLELKKSPGVQFAGIDEPDDVVNLTHQELFTRGGFIMIDRAALEPLSLCNMKKMSEILQELSRTGKWKWMLHYRDSRRLKENARLSAEAKEKKHFLNWCQETGILEVLPYHECDLMSRDQPDYLACLVRLQVQNISARYPVFLTDTTTDSTFGRNGIITMTFNSFLTCSPSETFTV